MAAAVVAAAATLGLLGRTLVRLQLVQAREGLEGALAAGRVRAFGPVRLGVPGGGWLRADYLLVGPGPRVWALLLDGVSQWRSPERAAAHLRRRAAAAERVAAAVRRALREGGLAALAVPADTPVVAAVVALRRRVPVPYRSGGAVVCNPEELADVLADRLQPVAETAALAAERRS